MPFRNIKYFTRLLNDDVTVIAEKVVEGKERDDKLRNHLRKPKCRKRDKTAAAAEIVTRTIRKPK